MRIIEFIKKKPWVLVIVAFSVLLGAWIFLLSVAIENKPDSVPYTSSSK